MVLVLFATEERPCAKYPIVGRGKSRWMGLIVQRGRLLHLYRIAGTNGQSPTFDRIPTWPEGQPIHAQGC